MRILHTLILLFVFGSLLSQETYQIIRDTTDASSIVHKTHEIPEIEVSSRRPLSAVKEGSLGIAIDLIELKKLPNIVSDADPFKALQFVGGISQAGEASSSMLVRGGENDQNLIFFNGVIVENPNHVLGLFSVFNPDLMDQMRYIKSGIPAEYGGRLSSVIDIKSFVSKPEKIELSGNIGLIASRLSLKSSITDNFSVYAAYRLSYINTLVIPILLQVGVKPEIAQNKIEFSDTNVGFNYRIGSSRLSGHFYTGADKLEVREANQFSIGQNFTAWGNTVGNLQFNHIFSEDFSMNHHLNFSQFNIHSHIDWINNLYNISSKSNMLQLKSDYAYLLDSHSLKMGYEASVEKIMPAAILYDNMPEDVNRRFNQSSFAAVYLRDEWEYGKLLLNVGLRASFYGRHPDSFDNRLLSSDGRKSVEKFYSGIEPRIFARWMLNDKASFKLSAGKHVQYVNRAHIVKVGIPVDIFVSASEKIKPTSLWQFSGGYFQSLWDENYEFSVEAYHKSFSNLIEFKGNLTDLFTTEILDDLLTEGKGKAFGLEFSVRKNKGDLTAWMNYTLAWNIRKFAEINHGKAFFAHNDRRHDLSFILLYDMNKKLSVGATFVYATGSRLNLPRSWYSMDDKIVLEFEGYNSFVMPAYHRVDLSLNYKLPTWKKVESNLMFAVYNVYNRANPFQVYYSTITGEGGGEYDFKIKMNYLLPILPTVSWTFRM